MASLRIHAWVSVGISLVLAGTTGAGGMAQPTSTRISSRIPCVQGHVSPVRMERDVMVVDEVQHGNDRAEHVGGGSTGGRECRREGVQERGSTGGREYGREYGNTGEGTSERGRE